MAPVTAFIRCRIVYLTIAATLLAAGCDDGGTAPDGATQIRLIAGDGIVDTIDARPIPAVVVEVTDGRGVPRAGVEVRFLVIGEPGPEPRLEVSGVATYWFNYSVRDTTDAMGRAAAVVRLGSRPGEAQVEARVTGESGVAIARITINPGAPADIVFSPQDTALHPGNSYTLVATVVDRRGNPVATSAQLTAATSHISVSGNQVRGLTIGRAHIVARAETLRDSSWVSVVPSGAIAVHRGSRVFVLNLDGSGLRDLVDEDVDQGNVGAPAWAHRGDTLVYVAGSNFGWPAYTRLMLKSLGGGTRDALPNEWKVGIGPGDFSADGAWLYFSRNGCNLDHALYRVRTDGGTPEQIGPPQSCFDGSAEYPSPSPGGDRIAYQLQGSRIVILDPASGVVTSPGVSGQRPRWSPVSDEIAYTRNEEVRVVRADGSGGRRVSASGRRYAPGLDWSPDGAWITARALDTSRLELIELATGVAVPLPYSTGMTQPAWRP